MERTYVTTSLEVARVANRKHGQVLRDIDRLRVLRPDTKAPEFEAARRTDAKGNSLRYYNLKSYALALLDVGQGKSALRWKGERLQSAPFQINSMQTEDSSHVAV